MAASTAPPEQTLFVRKATGLVKGWSAFDAFIYAAMAINIVTLGFGYAFTTIAFIPRGALIAAVVLSGLFLIFEVLVWASMISVMPRAGGDYVWQTRVWGGAVGFVLTVTGWWFIIWHWIPIYGQVLAVEVLQPALTILGFTGTSPLHADWWAYSTTDGNGIFVSSMLAAAVSAGVVAVGMRWYARIQKWCFYGGMLGLLIVIALFLFHSQADFISAFNRGATDLYGAGPNAYQEQVAASKEAGASEYAAFASFPVKETLLLIPFLVFWNLWPNWGAAIYGEVRGASDFRKNVYAMGAALVFTTVLTIVTFAAMAHSMGWNFYGILSAGYWGYFVGSVSFMPYPGTLAAFFLDNALLQLVVILLLSLWFVGWAGNVFLSSTRMIFAASFDRILPEWAARVDERTGVPRNALLLMVIPSIPISAMYAYSTDFYTYTLDAVLVFGVAYLGTTLAAVVLPWRRPDLYNNSPIAKYTILGIPMITVSGTAFALFLGYCLYKWFFDAAYFINNRQSLYYIIGLYGLAIAIYVISRVVRRRQGIDLTVVNREIPVE
ncbi:MAG: hypothetical protein QOF68_250 [Gaiellales bacterium]|nr:hypothetical protein [Gaiellales bacterium]